MWYPRIIGDRIAAEQLGPAVWTLPALVVVILEFLQPILLTLDPWPTAFVIGAAMHAAFTWLFPARLVPFSLATVASYVLFLDPSRFAAAAAHLGVVTP